MAVNRKPAKKTAKLSAKTTKPSELKGMNVRLSKELWKEIKQASFDEEQSINGIIVDLISKYIAKRKGV